MMEFTYEFTYISTACFSIISSKQTKINCQKVQTGEERCLSSAEVVGTGLIPSMFQGRDVYGSAPIGFC